jgi:predicted lipid-binding transport protein (Tim44 family)
LTGGLAAGLTLGLAFATFVHGTVQAQAQAQAIPLTLTAGSLPPPQRLIQVKVGERVRWAVTSDQAGELHVHAYRLSFEVAAKQVTAVEFTAHAAGRFKVEWHPKAQVSGGANGQAGGKAEKSAPHHAAALARLEVYPP